MRFWGTIAIALVMAGICSAQLLVPGALVQGDIYVTNASCAYSYQIKVYEANTLNYLTGASGEFLGSSHYKTYPLYSLPGYPFVDVKCIIKDAGGVTIFSETVQDVESVYYNDGGAVVDFYFMVGRESASSSASVDEPSYLTSALESSTWAEIKATY
ncbi:MAG: hypothetical protein QUS11_06795 [Candidatus Fermentibacter sp.]|nr:hypothetical protein [Candidatus Fermentibacter sp.]